MQISESKRDMDRSQELVRLVSSLIREDGITNTAWGGLIAARLSTPSPRQPISYNPSLCIVVQGRKRIFLGHESYTYDPLNYLVVPLALPLEMEVLEASPENPVLGLGLDLDMGLVSELLLNLDGTSSRPSTDDASRGALFVSQTSPEMQDALIRLLRLLSDPADLQILGRSVVREITYRVLQSEQGAQLRQLVLHNSDSYRIANLIRHLNGNFNEQMSIEDIARFAGMSTSNLHHKFRRVVGLSPLQYLKKIRLHRARAIMVEQGLNASEACFQVGYSNPSQFSREFKRLFGLPPGQMVRSFLSASS